MPERIGPTQTVSDIKPKNKPEFVSFSVEKTHADFSADLVEEPLSGLVVPAFPVYRCDSQSAYI